MFESKNYRKLSIDVKLKQWVSLVIDTKDLTTIKLIIFLGYIEYKTIFYNLNYALRIALNGLDNNQISWKSIETDVSWIHKDSNITINQINRIQHYIDMCLNDNYHVESYEIGFFERKTKRIEVWLDIMKK